MAGDENTNIPAPTYNMPDHKTLEIRETTVKVVNVDEIQNQLSTRLIQKSEIDAEVARLQGLLDVADEIAPPAPEPETPTPPAE